MVLCLLILKIANSAKNNDISQKIAHFSKFLYHVFLRFRQFWVFLFLLIQQSFLSKIAEASNQKKI